MSASQKCLQCAVLGDSDASAEVCQLAERIGTMLARMNVTVITGGRGGAMEAACRGAAQAGGLTVGILSSDDPAEANAFCKIVVPTGLGAARNAINVLAADFVIAVGQSAGTLSEVCFAWIHGKPIFVLKGCCGRWEQAVAGGVDHRDSSVVQVCDDLGDLRRHVQAFLAGSKCEPSS